MFERLSTRSSLVYKGIVERVGAGHSIDLLLVVTVDVLAYGASSESSSGSLRGFDEIGNLEMGG
jgi:hypothetical protein